MIVDTLNRADLYKNLGPRMADAFDYLKSTDFDTVEAGRHDINGDAVYALVMDIETKPVDQGGWEAHRKYIDVQYIVRGEERMLYAPSETLEPEGGYDAERDFQRLNGSGDLVTVRAGMFIVFYPDDAHGPCLAVDTPAFVRKVVVKIAVN